MKTTTLNEMYRDVILTSGLVDGAGGWQVVGIFADEADARSEDADMLAIGTTSREALSYEQRTIADENAAELCD